MKPIAIILCLLLSSLFAADAPQQAHESKDRIPVLAESLNTTHQLIGPLGKPVGLVFTMKVAVNEQRSKDAFVDAVTVSNVDGKELSQPITMDAHVSPFGNIKELTTGQTLTVRAYQGAGMTGLPDAPELVLVQGEACKFRTWLVIVTEIHEKK
jgi:hypothetical protein